MKAQHLVTGFQAEEAVVRYLERTESGFKLIARNVRYKQGEIDIVYETCKANGGLELVFIEVKASSESLDQALWNFTPAKQQKFKRAVQIYLSGSRTQAQSLKLGLALVSGEKIRILDWSY